MCLVVQRHPQWLQHLNSAARGGLCQIGLPLSAAMQAQARQLPCCGPAGWLQSHVQWMLHSRLGCCFKSASALPAMHTVSNPFWGFSVIPKTASALHCMHTVFSPAWVCRSRLPQPYKQRMLWQVLPACLMIVCLCAGMLPLDLLPRESWAGTCRRCGGTQPGCPVGRGCPQRGCSQEGQAPPREAQGPRASNRERQGLSSRSVECALLCTACTWL